MPSLADGGAADIARIGDSEPVEVLQGEVDAPAVAVLRDVLPVLQQLQRGGDLVGGALDGASRRGVDLEHGEDEPADRLGRESAVAEQLVPGPVPRDLLV